VSTYLAVSLRESLAEAQQAVEDHAGSGRNGRCLACGQMEPCLARVAAGLMLVRYDRLPRRVPGLAARGLW
jgi:hypothetical protein